MKTFAGLWCGAGKELLERVHEVPILRLTIKRTGPCFALIPWSPDLDWLDGEVRSWKACQVRRTHPDERIAMRDLVVELGADIGTLIQGDCAAIDRAEIALAEARIVQDGAVGKYESPRVHCRTRVQWLGFQDTEEWGPYPVAIQELQQRLRPSALDERWARAIRRTS